jgi:hypothetical protein
MNTLKPVSTGSLQEKRPTMKSILNHSFRYTSSVETDLRKTFAKVRRELRRDSERSDVAAGRNVLSIRPADRSSAAK